MNTLYDKFQHLKANFVMSCSQNALKSLEKSIFFPGKVWKTTVRFLYEPCAVHSVVSEL